MGAWTQAQAEAEAAKQQTVMCWLRVLPGPVFFWSWEVVSRQYQKNGTLHSCLQLN
jgi:hypothetical protein